MQVHFDTHRQEADYVYTDKKGVPHAYPQFSVEVTIRNDRRRVSCSDARDGHICIHDLAVRFSSGDKVWPGTAAYWVESGNVNNLRPNIDKRGHFILAGYIADYETKPVRSQHNAVA